MSYQDICKGLNKKASAEQIKQLAVTIKKLQMKKKAGLEDPITDTQVTEARLDRQQNIANAAKPKPGWGMRAVNAYNKAVRYPVELAWNSHPVVQAYNWAKNRGYKQGRKDVINQATPLLTAAKKNQAALTNKYNDLQGRYYALQQQHNGSWWVRLLNWIGNLFSGKAFQQ